MSVVQPSIAADPPPLDRPSRRGANPHRTAKAPPGAAVWLFSAWMACFALAPIKVEGGDLACVGDCNGDGKVTIGELVTAVNIALGQLASSECSAADANRSGGLTVDELIQAVGNAMSNCGAGGTVADGLQALRAGNLVAARNAFTLAAAAHPDDGVVRLYALFSRLAVELLSDQRLRAMLAANGAELVGSAEQVCDLQVAGPVIVPTGAPSVDAIVGAVRDIFLPRITDALVGLQVAIDAGTVVALDTQYFPSCVEPPISLPILDIDRGDLLAGQAGLLALRGAIDVAGAYNLEIGLHDVLNSPLQPQLEANAGLLTLRSRDRLTSARAAFDAALQSAIAAIDEIRSERDQQDDDLLVLMEEDDAETEQLLQLAILVRQSLYDEIVIPAQPGLPTSQRLNLSRLFDGTISSMRTLLRFDSGGDIDPRRFPDPAFGGIAPDLTQSGIDELIDGGRRCVACESGDDCAGLGPRSLYCGYCYYACTGETMRCTGNGSYTCTDGEFY